LADEEESALSHFVMSKSVYAQLPSATPTGIVPGVPIPDRARDRAYDERVEADLPIAEFGFPGPLREKLVEAILRGEKTSTAGLFEESRRDGAPIASVGTRELVVDSQGRGVAVIETTKVEVKRMGDVDLAFAIDEGEGFETFQDWRAAHVRFFTSPEMVATLGDPPLQIDDDTIMVCTRFVVVERLQV
jgi:uncharacterized protein YhfF